MVARVQNSLPSLRMWRIHCGLTLQDVARQMNVAISSVHKWEVGRAPVSFEILQRLAELFGTEPAALLFPPDDQADIGKLRAVFRIATLGDPELVDAWIELGNKFIRGCDGGEPTVKPETGSPRAKRARREH